jgi:hypothetical protein
MRAKLRKLKRMTASLSNRGRSRGTLEATEEHLDLVALFVEGPVFCALMPGTATNMGSLSDIRGRCHGTLAPGTRALPGDRVKAMAFGPPRRSYER